MVAFKAVMDYAASRRYIPADHRFSELRKFRKNRRDEFTPEEYRRLNTNGTYGTRPSVRKDKPVPPIW